MQHTSTIKNNVKDTAVWQDCQYPSFPRLICQKEKLAWKGYNKLTENKLDHHKFHSPFKLVLKRLYTINTLCCYQVSNSIYAKTIYAKATASLI